MRRVDEITPLKEAIGIIESGESETIEFKERWSDRSALCELAVFANSGGGTLFEQVEAVMSQFRQYLQVHYDISLSGRGGEDAKGTEGMQRSEVWDYPLTALEEAAINALIHRDYAALGNVEVRVFDDRVVVSNPGGLPEPLTIEELQREGHDSIRHNSRYLLKRPGNE